MNDLTSDLFNQRVPAVQTLLKSHSEFSPEKRMEISNICKESFAQLKNDLVEFNKFANDSSYKMLDRISNLQLWTTHLKAVQELLQSEVSDPFLLNLFKDEGTAAVEALDKQLLENFQSFVKETEKWEQNPKETISTRLKKTIENTFTKLIDLASIHGQNHLISVLEKRRDFICSHFQPYHLIRDQIVEKKYNTEPELFHSVLSFAERSIPLAEQAIENAETFKNAGLTLKEIADYIQKLDSANRGFTFLDDTESNNQDTSPTKIILECLKFFKSEPQDSPEKLRGSIEKFLSSLRFYNLKEKLLILKACNSENGEIYKRLFLSKIPASEIKQYLLQETGNDDAYYRLFNQNWNLSDWPEKFSLCYQLNEKQLKPVLHKITNSVYENKIEKIREFSPELKEVLYLLFQQIEHCDSDLSQKCWQLVQRCNKLSEIKKLLKILQKDQKYIEFLGKLPENLLHVVLNHSDISKKINFLSELEFYFQTYFISLLNDDFAYEDSLKIYKKDPGLLKIQISLQDSVGGQSLKNIKGKNSILYFHRHPELLKAYIEAPQRSYSFSQMDHPIESLIQNRENWIEKIFFLFENHTDFDGLFTYLTKASPNKSIVCLLDQDLSLIKKYQSEFKSIGRELIKTLDLQDRASETEIHEAITKMLPLANSEGEFFKELAQHFSVNDAKKISEFITQFTLIEDEKIKSKVVQFIRDGYFSTACLCLKHQFSEKIDTLSPSELFEQIVKQYPAETQNEINNILQFWNHSNEQLSYAELSKSQFSLLSELLMLSNTNPKVFSIMASLFRSFPLPEGEKLLQLKNLHVTDFERFQAFLKVKPEYGWHLLDYLIKNPTNGLNLLSSYFPHQPQVIACFRSRNPAQALNLMIRDKSQRQTTRFGSFQVSNPSFGNTLLPELTRSGAKNIKRLESLLSNASSESLIYLQQLIFFEIHDLNSQLVTMLLDLFPKKYENLALLGMEGYSQEATELLRRFQQDTPVSPFIELLLKTPSSDGRWLTAALKLDQKSNRLINHLCRSKFVGDLEKQMTYLAASGDLQTVDRLLDALEKTSQGKSPQSQALLDWTAQGNLTFVQWIEREDTVNKDPIYQKIRACSPSDLQEGLIQLYRNLSENTSLRNDSVDWILGQKNPHEQLAKLLYLQAQNIKIDNLETVDTLFQNHDPVAQINAAMASIVYEPTFTSTEKHLKAQFQFAVVASAVLLNSDGSINKGLIKEVKKADFFLENQAKGTTVYAYLDWVLNLFETNGEFSERLVKGTGIPPQESPAYHLLLETLGKEKEEVLTRRDIQVAILSSLLQRTWQSPKVGSCFGTAIVSQSQATASFLLQSLDDYLELAAHNRLQRTLKNCTTAYPLSRNLKTSSSEHPFAKAREYCISSMGATRDSSSIRSLTAKTFNKITFFLGSLARENPESYEAVQALQQQFTQDFLRGTLEFYDPFLSWTKKDMEHLGMDIQGMLGGWILGKTNSDTRIDTQEKFEAYLLELVEVLATKNDSPLFLQGVALLKERIINHDLSKLGEERQNATSWTYAAGGNSEVTAENYFEQEAKRRLSIQTNLKEDSWESHLDDLKLLKTYASCIGPASQGKISISSENHAYSLIPEKLLSLNEYQTFEDLHAVLLKTSNTFAQLPITAALSASWVDAICLFFSEKTGESLRDYLKAHPIPEGNLRDYGWALTDALMRVSSASVKDMNAAKVEAALLNLPELKNERPEYVIVGDYNWFDNQNACYAAYAISPFTNQLEPYRVTEKGLNLYPQYRIGTGIKISSKNVEKPWQPLQKR